MAGAAKAITRAVTPPKPKMPAAPEPVAATPAQTQTQAMAAQSEAVQAETKRLDNAEAEDAARRRALTGRMAGRALLLNSEVGVPQTKLGG